MASQKQLEANRANARRSTGPRTPLGKTNARLNALTHGLTAAKQTVIDGEDPKEFETFRAGLINDLNPIGSFQRCLASLIIDTCWRLKRIGRIEAALFRKELKAAEAEYRRYHGSNGSAVQELRDEIEAMRRRMLPELEGDHVQDHPQVEAEVTIEKKDEAAKLSEEARQQCQDRAFAILLDDNRLGNLSRYEASLMNILTRNMRLFSLIREADGASRVIESVAVVPPPPPQR